MSSSSLSPTLPRTRCTSNACGAPSSRRTSPERDEVLHRKPGDVGERHASVPRSDSALPRRRRPAPLSMATRLGVERPAYDRPVGRRSQTETVAGIYQAFLQRRTWPQAALAKDLDLTVGTLRRVLFELQAEGMPLHRDEDHPQLYWSVPKDWYPGSVLFKRAEVPELLRQLRRVPRGVGRRRLLDIVLDRLPGIEANSPTVITHEPSPQEEQYLSVVEDSSARVSLWMKYYTASRGDVGERHASVHRVHAGPPARFIATCHRSGTLRTFRVDGILWARLDPDERFRPASEAEVDAYDT